MSVPDRIRDSVRSILTVPAAPVFEPPAVPTDDDGASALKYERALAEYNQKREAQKKRHQETSATIRRVYYAIISTALFCFSTIHGKEGLGYITTDSVVSLPIIEIPVKYTVFLLAGPAVIIGLTIYVHIFLEEHQKVRVEQEERLATIFNMDGVAAQFVSNAIFYWLPPLMLFYFAWESKPLRLAGPLLLTASAAATLVLFVLQLRRTRLRPVMTAIVSVGFLTTAATCGLFYTLTGGKFILDRATLIVDRDLTVMRLSGATLEGVTMTRVDLQGVDLSHANLAGATIEDSKLNGSNLTGAELAGATFQNVDLEGAVLVNAVLSNAQMLEGTNVNLAVLAGARLDGADLSGVEDLRANQLVGSCRDGATQFPAYLEARIAELGLQSCHRRENDIEVGGPSLTGSIEEQDGEGEFTFGITSQGIYQIDVESVATQVNSDFDPSIVVRGPNLASELTDDDGGEIWNSRIIHPFSPGLYTLVVTEYDGLPGSFSVKVAPWDQRSLSGFQGAQIPGSTDRIPTIVVAKGDPRASLNLPRGRDSNPSWIALENPGRQSILIRASSADPAITSDLELALFDASAPYAPIARPEIGPDRVIRCTLGAERYLVLVGPWGESASIDVSVEIADESAKDVENTCFAN